MNTQIINSLKELPKVIAMSNEENIVVILRRIEEKLDAVLAKKSEKPKAVKGPPTRNGRGVIQATILQLLKDGRPRHLLSIAQDIQSLNLTPFPVTEASAQTACFKLWKTGQLDKVRKGVYKSKEQV